MSAQVAKMTAQKDSTISTLLAVSFVLSGLNYAAAKSTTTHPADMPTAVHNAVAVTDVVWFDASRGRTIPARIYYPAGSGNERFPVILFSPGLGQSRDDCAYLGRHWAGCGYVSVHVQHPGSDKAAERGLRPRKELQRAFYDPSNIRNRPLDIMFAIGRLDEMTQKSSSPGDRFDMTRIGVSGHDFGAQTVLALAGQVLPGKLAFKEHRVKAVVAMSAPVPLGQVPLTLAYGDVSLPCLHITGTADNSIVATTTASQRRLPFDYTSGVDQFLVTLQGADHLTYSGHALARNSGHDALFHQLIADCSTAFWDAYLKDRPAAKTWLAGRGIIDLLGVNGRVEKKLVP